MLQTKPKVDDYRLSVALDCISLFSYSVEDTIRFDEIMGYAEMLGFEDVDDKLFILHCVKAMERSMAEHANKKFKEKTKSVRKK